MVCRLTAGLKLRLTAVCVVFDPAARLAATAAELLLGWEGQLQADRFRSHTPRRTTTSDPQSISVAPGSACSKAAVKTDYRRPDARRIISRLSAEFA